MTVDVADVAGLTDAELESALTEWAGHLAAGEATFVDLVGEFDAREAWGGIGVLSCAHWLAWRCSLGAGAARERVRVATPATEATLVDCARHSTATHLERLVAGMRRAVQTRDRCCQFPGCTRTKRLIVHHIVPWHRGGPTDLTNLVLLALLLPSPPRPRRRLLVQPQHDRPDRRARPRRMAATRRAAAAPLKRRTARSQQRRNRRRRLRGNTATGLEGRPPPPQLRRRRTPRGVANALSARGAVRLGGGSVIDDDGHQLVGVAAGEPRLGWRRG
ncbi:MAG: HNH endonuclease signature motif containing protein [Mycobacteriales bacterium]